ncbi:uncharacterized protein LOC134249768, partial [Saccostrea cucullata]|uniref:uncharacterized protein LOC134249768 n=1 Tax=Saccostrea cuccullata TaxID=36930 RepID=UPI002ED249C9
VCEPRCQNNGRCVGPNSCQCNGYSGVRCDQPICDPPCMNGGTCTRSRSCSCISSYTGSHCSIPVCNPSCINGGTCVAPNKCMCTATYTGATCEIPLCSYHLPCFPGTCTDSIHCQCKEGFSGNSGLDLCRSMTSLASPTISQCSSFLANIERTGQKRELYKFMADSSGTNSTGISTRWVNRKDYNFINVQFSATFQNLHGVNSPGYIDDFKFGIVSGMIQMDLSKSDRNDSSKAFISINSTILKCPNNPGSISPNEDVFWCNLTNANFDRLLEHGDNLTLTAIATNGGYRKLKTPDGDRVNTFIGQNASKSTQFLFDLVNPNHCLLHGKCQAIAFNVEEDITKHAIHFSWNGWVDNMSGIEKYVIQKYLLEADNEVPPKLCEKDPWRPLETFELNRTSSSFVHLPEKPGMYSFLLNVVDAANNTEYARTLVLYDPISKITVLNTTSTRIKVTSAKEETGYMWQDNLDGMIEISWKKHFQNKFHFENKLLNPVKPYKYFEFTTNIKKYVNPRMEDLDGNRTLKGIQNIYGITKFEYAYKHGNLGNATPVFWTQVNDSLSETQTFFVSRQNGDIINIWIRATDVMGNTKIGVTPLYFDSSPPTQLTHNDVIFSPNLNLTTYAFSSRLQIDVSDVESGIATIYWRLIAMDSGIVFKSGNITGNKTLNNPGLRNGYQIATGEYFYISHFLDVNNCWMVVSKENFPTESVLLELIVSNMAMKSISFNTTISDLKSLDGMDEYSGPMHLLLEIMDHLQIIDYYRIVNPDKKDIHLEKNLDFDK